jgi:uncharacterized membrane protein SpoIIM required for sporulation
MTPLQFETGHAPLWRELEAALDRLENGRESKRAARRRARLSGDTPSPSPDPARLAALYRSVCEHLALARSRAYPVHLVARLEGLAARAHQLVYRRSDYGLARLAQLFLLDFPRAVRAHRRYVLVATLVFAVPLIVLGVATWVDPGFILTMHDAQTVRNYEEMYGSGTGSIGRERAAQTDWMMFGFYIRNNISVAFQCFASGIFLGIGSLVALVFNGISAGSIAGFLTARGHGETFYSFVVTHGAFELTAIVLAGAAGLRLGHALLSPGRLTRRAALEAAARDTAVLIYGVIAMLTIAAALEAFWSSARWVAPAVKFGVGGGCWALVLGYLGWQGRGGRAGLGRAGYAALEQA